MTAFHYLYRLILIIQSLFYLLLQGPFIRIFHKLLWNHAVFPKNCSWFPILQFLWYFYPKWMAYGAFLSNGKTVVFLIFMNINTKCETFWGVRWFCTTMAGPGCQSFASMRVELGTYCRRHINHPHLSELSHGLIDDSIQPLADFLLNAIAQETLSWLGPLFEGFLPWFDRTPVIWSFFALDLIDFVVLSQT